MCNIKRRRKRNPYMTRRYWIHKLHTRIACVMLVIMLFFTVANMNHINQINLYSEICG